MSAFSIEIDYPLESPIINIKQIILQFVSWYIYVMGNREYKDVSSANSLVLEATD